MDVTQDVCVCQERYVIHPNTSICLRKPDNCIGAIVQNEVVVCTSCDKKYAYLENGECKTGTVAYCDEFNPTQNLCVKCLNGYYLENNICKPHTNGLDSLCNIWSQNNRDVCETCANSATKFKKIKHCKSVNEVIPNCKVYSDIFSC